LFSFIKCFVLVAPVKSGTRGRKTSAKRKNRSRGVVSLRRKAHVAQIQSGTRNHYPLLWDATASAVGVSVPWQAIVPQRKMGSGKKWGRARGRTRSFECDDKQRGTFHVG